MYILYSIVISCRSTVILRSSSYSSLFYLHFRGLVFLIQLLIRISRDLKPWQRQFVAATHQRTCCIDPASPVHCWCGVPRLVLSRAEPLMASETMGWVGTQMTYPPVSSVPWLENTTQMQATFDDTGGYPRTLVAHPTE